MLPAELIGPGKAIEFDSPEAFLSENRVRYPNLDPDFIVQICFEHPGRFNDLLPKFDPRRHSAVRVQRTVGWVYDNVRYENNEELDFWAEHFDSQLSSGKRSYEVFTHMVDHGEWPFPPVVVEASFALTLGAPRSVGRPYHLIEGTHRVSYLRRMVQLDMLPREKLVFLIEVTG